MINIPHIFQPSPIKAVVSCTMNILVAPLTTFVI